MAASSSNQALILPPSAVTNALAAEDIRDIKPPVPIPSAWGWLGWIALGLVLAALGFWLARWWRQRRLRPAAPALVIPPHVRARDRLRQALELIRQPKPFCVLVSDTLRIYLEERFQFHAPERTTEEFLEELQSSVLLKLSQKRILADFLMRCDLVKFARHEPAEPELRDLLETALRLVDETVLDEIEEPAVAGEAGRIPT